MKRIAYLIAASLTLAAGVAQARDNIEIVGSSTVYPFSTVVAENYAKKTGNPAPKVESTGTGGGMKLFCAGAGIDSPDITNASRRIKESELADCQKNGVSPIEIKVGYDGIAIANAKDAKQFDLTASDIFLALAKQVPSADGKLTDNTFKTWHDVNDKLPETKIEVLGPPPTSGTRDAFVEMVMTAGCKKIDWVKDLEKTDDAKFKAICGSIREDGAYIEAGENDNLIVQKLQANKDSLGIFGYSYLEENTDKVQGSKINGVDIDFDTISSGEYSVSRPLFIYVKKEHVGTVKGIEEYVAEFTADSAWGSDGYLADKGMIPMGDAERQQYAKAAKDLTALTTLK